MKSPEKKLKEYIKKKYGSIDVSTPIVKMIKKEREATRCEMCKAIISLKKSFVYKSMMSYLTHSSDMKVCEACAKREHGPKNKYKWKELINDLEKRSENEQ